MIKKILIANRGEIAVRIIRAAKEMGISTAAIYSDTDENSQHANLADQKFPLHGNTPAESYLDINKIIKIAKDSNTDAIHPGYGFLSERPEFADACQKAKITFIGPTAESMKKLGSKIEAKKLAESIKVPLVPGYFEPGATSEVLLAEAKKIGFPVMLKASAGGGGRGMRIVHREKDFEKEFEMAADEAQKSFGDDAMMVEKYIAQPRHIEIQILADKKGNLATLFERECSLQRRHQKLIEESPSPIFINPENNLTETLWPKMRDAAIKLAEAVSYHGAGTVEFMVDDQEEKFYFLEVNTRLQVEHPVTELITGTDLVQSQILVASGMALEQILPKSFICRESIQGHAIEARIIAEDPENNFLPSIGKIIGWAEPNYPGVRLDTGYGPGSEVSKYYDSLLAKLIVHAPTRDQAIRKMVLALKDFHILGIKTNIPYLLDLVQSEAFQKGEFDTNYIERELTDWQPEENIPDYIQKLFYKADQRSSGNQPAKEAIEQNAWSIGDGWRNYQ